MVREQTICHRPGQRTAAFLGIHLNSDCGLATLSPSSSCADGIAQVGWPLQFYMSGGFMYQQNFNFWFLLIDLAFGMAMGLILGWIFSRRKKLYRNKVFVL